MKPHAPITCNEDTTVIEVIKKLSENHIHRIYIVDKNERPIGIVSMSDIIVALNTD